MYDIQWYKSNALIPYPQAVALMEDRVEKIRHYQASEMVWLLEHPALYTAGSSARTHELLDAGRFPVYKSGRGGKYTYHGPGQRIAYTLLDLRKRGRDLHGLILQLEEWVIRTLALLGLQGQRRVGHIGVWVGEAKIASIGLRVRHWVSFHGMSLNVCPRLEHFEGIIPCGLPDSPITSLQALGYMYSLFEVDAVLKAAWTQVFGDSLQEAERAPADSRSVG